MAKVTNWKWKLAGILLALSFFFIAFIFTATGQNWLKSKIDEAYEALPEDQRRDSAWADRFLDLAWFKANIAQAYEPAMDMYCDFCGARQDERGRDFTVDGKLRGKCSADGKTGWGPFHPRAPEAFWNYIETDYAQGKTAQRTAEKCVKYYELFYTWMIIHSPEHKPHPLFNKYWPKIKDLVQLNLNRGFPSDKVNVHAPLAAPYSDGK